MNPFSCLTCRFKLLSGSDTNTPVCVSGDAVTMRALFGPKVPPFCKLSYRKRANICAGRRESRLNPVQHRLATHIQQMLHLLEHSFINIHGYSKFKLFFFFYYYYFTA